ncbi:MAG: FAD-binding oxidoreductase [Candidatus Saccharimonadales bacterium]
MILDPYTWHDATIAERTYESPDAVSLRVSLPSSYRYRPGQHAIVKLVLPDGTSTLRQYSFASSPRSGTVWLTIVRSPGGVVSSWAIDKAAVGDRLEVSQPFQGPLCQFVNPLRHVTMIAGGSGVVPIMSHLRDLRLRQQSTPITVLYSCRSAARCFETELVASAPHETIIRRETDLTTRFSPSEITAHITDDTTVFICGSRGFVTAMRDVVYKASPTTPIFAEAFSLD